MGLRLLSGLRATVRSATTEPQMVDDFSGEGEMPGKTLFAAPASATALMVAFMAAPGPAAAMTLTFSWAGYKACSSRSPAFMVAEVPTGAVRLAFNMIDKDVPGYHHGGGTVAYAGNGEIAAGAFSYRGPCPPAGQRHTYEWTVRALDKGGSVLGSASAAAQFPP